MTAFSDLFSDETGAAPTGWTRRFSTGGTLTGEAAQPGTLRLSIGSNAARGVTLDALGNSTDCEILTRFQVTSVANGLAASTGYGGALLRGSGSAGSEVGYMALLATDASSLANRLRLARYSPAGTGAVLNEVAFSWSIGTWYWMRFRANGTGNPSVQIRVWADGTPEPYDWTIDHVDAGQQRITTTGFAGVFVNACGTSSGTTQYDYDWMTFATAGETATPPYNQGAIYYNGAAGSAGPSQHTSRWVTANTTVAENSGGFCRISKVTSGGRYLLSADMIPTSNDIELLVKCRTSVPVNNINNLGIAARASGAAAAENGYVFTLSENASAQFALRLTKYLAGSPTTLAEPLYTWAANEWHWLRLRCNGTTISGTAWKDGNAEPSTPQISVTDSGISGGGWAGLFEYIINSNSDYDYLSWADGGGTAPGPTSNVKESFDSADGLQPDDFRKFWQSTSTFTETASGYLRATPSAQARNALFWDAISVSADIELLVKIRTDTKVTGQPSFQVILRGSGAAAAENGYRFHLAEPAGSELRISKYTAGTAADIGTNQSFSWSTNTWYWLRARANGTTLTFKVWADGNAEPGSPQRTETDSAFASGGMNGIMAFIVGNIDVDYMSYATAGGVAPGPGSTVSYVLDAEAGAYTVGGVAVTLTAPSPNKIITVGVGAYTLGGQAANLISTYVVPVGTGAYTYTGVNVTISKSGATAYIMPVGIANYDVTGQTVSLLSSSGNRRHLIGFYYAQAQTANVSRPDSIVGWTIPLAFEFTAFDTKSNMQAGVNNVSTFWKNYNASNPTKRRRLYLSLPTTTSDRGVTDDLLANGTTQDSFIDALADKLINDGHSDALIRIGWEVNGTWYPWGNSGSPNYTRNYANFIGAWRKIVDRFRARATALGATGVFEFVWALAIGPFYNGATLMSPTVWYPGDAYVDWIAPDAYGQVYDSRNKTPTELWDRDSWGFDADHAGGTPTNGNSGHQVYHLQWYAREAALRGKKFGIAEGGVGWAPDDSGFGDADYWWQKVSEMFTTWGPVSGALLGVFDVGPPGTTDYYSVFSSAQNFTGTAPTLPTDWYKQKDRTCWAFRHYFGDLSAVADLSTAVFETNAPSGVSVNLYSGYGTPPNCVIPLGTPDGTEIGHITVTGGERVWSLDAGQHDGTSNTDNGDKVQVLFISEGFIAPGSSPDGGKLIVRGAKVDRLLGLTGKKQVLGVRNALGGLNYTLNVSVAAVAGTTKGWDFFDDSSLTGTTERWDGNLTLWSEDATPPGYERATVTTTANSQRNIRTIDSPGYQTDIDVATQIRFAAATPPYAPPAGTSYAIGGVVARATGSMGSETAYAAVLRVETDGTRQFYLRKYVNGALTNLATKSYAFVENTWYEIRLQAIGSTIKAKIWLASAAEPGTWDHTVTDTSITTAGATGMFTGWGGQNTIVDFDYFGWDAIGGSPVPVAAGQQIAVGQGAYALTGNDVTLRYAPVVGGIAIGTAGTGVYAGLSLAWGDDFVAKPSMWSYRNLGGKWMPVGRGGDRRFNATEKQIFMDPLYRGPRSESPTDLGFDPFSVTASVLSVTAALRAAGLDTHVPYNNNGAVVDAMDNQGRPLLTSGALRANPQFMLSVEGNFAIEVKGELPAGAINGFWPAMLWITGLFRSTTKEWGEYDLLEGWNGAARWINSTLHVGPAQGIGPTSQTKLATDRVVPTGRQVQGLLVRNGNTLTYYDDFASAGTMAQVGTYTDARVGYLTGSHAITLDLAVATDVLSGTGSFNSAHWPATMKVDWIRVWTPTGSTPPADWTQLPSKNVNPGDAWDDTFPSTIWSGFTPDREDVMGLFDNEDNPGQLIRSLSDGNLPGGMSVDMSARTATGTVPMGEGGRVGIMLFGSKTAGGASRLAFKYWNVAPAPQPSLFHDCYPSIGESFSRTVAYTDFHSGNLGAHTYNVVKVSGGTDLTITGNGGQSVTISGTIATPETTVLRIDCTNTVGQVTSVTRVIDAAARPFHWDFVAGIFRHQGVTYADLPAVVTAGKASYATTVPASGTLYSQDNAGNLTSRAASVPRISDRGLVYEGVVSNAMGAGLGANNRVLNAVTVTADVMTGPSGSVTADRVIETTANSGHWVSSYTGGVNYANATSYFGQAYVKLGSTRYVQLAFSNSAFPSNEAYITCDLLRGRVAKAGTAVTLSGVEMAHFLGKGWFRFYFFATTEVAANAANGLMVGFSGESTTAAKQPAYAGSVNQFFYLWGVGMEARDPTAVSLGLPAFLLNQLTGTTAAANAMSKVADALSVFVPTGVTSLRVVFDDDNTQDLIGLTPNALNAIPTPSVTTPGALNRRFIREIFGLYNSYVLTADFANYDVIGNAVTLTTSGISTTAYVMPAATGAYTIGGVAVSLRQSVIKMPADLGQYTVLGRPVTLSYGSLSGARILSVALGIYTVQGFDVSMAVGGAPVAIPRNIRADLSTLRTVGVVEMFEFDDRNIGGNTVLHWHAGTTIAGLPVWWQGIQYDPFPVQATGFAMAHGGSLPRPTFKCSNIGGLVGNYLRIMADAVGAKVTRRRTLTRYMDARNFLNGNPYADPNAHFPDDIFYVARKSSMDSIFIEIELAMSYDVTGVQLPRRQVLSGTCPWVYRSAECGYAGPPVQDIQGNPTSDPAKDRCRKTLSACKARFGKNGVLNIGAFPGSALIGGGG